MKKWTIALDTPIYLNLKNDAGVISSEVLPPPMLSSTAYNHWREDPGGEKLKQNFEVDKKWTLMEKGAKTKTEGGKLNSSRQRLGCLLCSHC